MRLLVIVAVLVPALAAADVIVGLRGRDDAGLARLLAGQQSPASPDFRRWLTPDEFAARFAAPADALRRVSRWLRSTGCAVQRLPGRQFVRCRHRHVVVPPAELGPLVDGIVDPGVITVVRRPVAAYRPASIGSQGGFFFSPAEFARTYGLDIGTAAGFDGSGVTIGLLGISAIGIEDLAEFRTLFGLPPANFTQSSGPRTGDIAEAEAVLDVSWSGAVAPAAQVFLAIANSPDQAFGLLIASNTADVISSSIDFCPPTRRVRAAANRIVSRALRQAQAQGQTILVASGDTGPHDCADGGFGLLTSSPLVTAVGGTTPSPVLDASGTAIAYGSESVWNEGGPAASGGGPTTVRRPRYQRGLGRVGPKRTIPDVAFPAARVYPLVLRGLHLLAGGTSAAAPAWAGVVARLVQQHGGRVGFLNPRLYQLGRAQRRGGSAVFHDVVTGDNGIATQRGFPARPGYDLATGWGSIDGATFFDVFAGP